MAISFDASSQGYNDGTGSTTSSISHTVGSGSNRLLIVSIFHQDTDQTVSGVTADGVAMTFLARTSFGSGGTARKIEMWYLLTPNVGSQTITATFTGNTNWRSLIATSYFGVKQTDFPDASATPSSSSSSTIVGTLTVGENAWQVFHSQGQENYISTSATFRNAGFGTSLPGNPIYSDSNGALAAGSRSITHTRSGTGTHVGITASFLPSADPSGPANLKTYNTNVKSNIKTINTNPIANVKSFNTNV